jgi:signal transduction histidine kinase
LLANAIKFTNSGCVSVNADYDPSTSYITVSVEDDGIGISFED